MRTTFRRNSAAWAYAGGSLIAYAAGEERDAGEMLIEEQDTNVVPSSLASWAARGECSVEQAETSSPLGRPAQRLKLSATASSSWFDKAAIAMPERTQRPATSFLVWPDGARYVGIVMSRNNAIQSTTYFDLRDLTVSSDGHPSAILSPNAKASVRDMGDGWYLCASQRQMSYGNVGITGFDSFGGTYSRDIVASPERSVLIDVVTAQDRLHSSPIVSNGAALTRSADMLDAPADGWLPGGRHTWRGLVRMSADPREPTILGHPGGRIYASGGRLLLDGPGTLWQPDGEHAAGAIVPFYWTVELPGAAPDFALGRSFGNSDWWNSHLVDIVPYPRVISEAEIRRDLGL